MIKILHIETMLNTKQSNFQKLFYGKITLDKSDQYSE